MPLPPGFVPPCLPTKAPQPPTGDAWLHEIKHDGFRAVARKDGERVRLYSRPGNDLTYRFTLIIERRAELRHPTRENAGAARARPNRSHHSASLRQRPRDAPVRREAEENWSFGYRPSRRTSGLPCGGGRPALLTVEHLSFRPHLLLTSI